MLSFFFIFRNYLFSRRYCGERLAQTWHVTLTSRQVWLVFLGVLVTFIPCCWRARFSFWVCLELNIFSNLVCLIKFILWYSFGNSFSYLARFLLLTICMFNSLVVDLLARTRNHLKKRPRVHNFGELNILNLITVNIICK